MSGTEGKRLLVNTELNQREIMTETSQNELHLGRPNLQQIVNLCLTKGFLIKRVVLGLVLEMKMITTTLINLFLLIEPWHLFIKM